MYYITKELEIIKDKKARADEESTYFESRNDIVQNYDENYIDGEAVKVTKVPNELVFTSKTKAEEKRADLVQGMTLVGVKQNSESIKALTTAQLSRADTFRIQLSRAEESTRQILSYVNSTYNGVTKTHNEINERINLIKNTMMVQSISILIIVSLVLLF
jgi:hypothetical protein